MTNTHTTETDAPRVNLYLPNPGFYEGSYLANWIDSESEYELDYLMTECGKTAEEAQKTCERFYSKETQNALASLYVTHFCDYLSDTLQLPKLDARFEAVISPAYYNFESDKIEISLPENQARLLYDALMKNTACREHASEMCTSRPGFISFTDNNLSSPAWQFENLRPYMWEVLIAALEDEFVESEFWWDMDDRRSETIHNA